MADFMESGHKKNQYMADSLPLDNKLNKVV